MLFFASLCLLGYSLNPSNQQMSFSLNYTFPGTPVDCPNEEVSQNDGNENEKVINSKNYKTNDKDDDDEDGEHEGDLFSQPSASYLSVFKLFFSPKFEIYSSLRSPLLDLQYLSLKIDDWLYFSYMYVCMLLTLICLFNITDICCTNNFLSVPIYSLSIINLCVSMPQYNQYYCTLVEFPNLTFTHKNMKLLCRYIIGIRHSCVIYSDQL